MIYFCLKLRNFSCESFFEASGYGVSSNEQTSHIEFLWNFDYYVLEFTSNQNLFSFWRDDCWMGESGKKTFHFPLEKR